MGTTSALPTFSSPTLICLIEAKDVFVPGLTVGTRAEDRIGGLSVGRTGHTALRVNHSNGCGANESPPLLVDLV
ncbi:MAG: hypothetical protein GC183_14880 [Thiobacillus sp.]|nr:hypothetical protein [Thiobacillus sp.]